MALTFTTVRGQSIATIYNFTNGPANPQTALTLGLDGNFYGTTSQGGGANEGTVFMVTTQGTFTTLVGGINPSGLTLGPDGNFYGISPYRGWEEGVVFKVSPGSLTTFNLNANPDVGFPSSGLTLGPDGGFYGIAAVDASDTGGIYRVTTTGAVASVAVFNTDSGFWPAGVLTLGPDGNFYGSATSTAITSAGTIFRVTTNGSLTTLVTNIFCAALTLGLDGNFYGTTLGTVFKMTTNGSLTTLVSSNFSSGSYPFSAGLTLGPDGNFYGTTSSGGDTNLNNGLGYGTVFKVTTNGTLTTLASFEGGNGAVPESSLTLGSDGNFYGTTYSGGSGSNGTIFRLNLPPDFITSPANESIAIGGAATFSCQHFGTAPMSFQWLSNDIPIVAATNSSLTVNYTSWQADPGVQFQVVVANAWGSITSSVASVYLLPSNNSQAVITPIYSFNSSGTDGANPYAGLTLGPDGNLYGTTYNGGSGGGYGTVFQVTTNGSLTTLVNFNSTNGAYPYAGLTLGPDGDFYGTTTHGGNYGGAGYGIYATYGTVFEMTAGGNLTTLVNFDSTNGANPYAGLTLGPDGNFYGTTTHGGTSVASGTTSGTVFSMSPSGTLTTLAGFGLFDGGEPQAALTLGLDGNFYGTTYGGAVPGGTEVWGSAFRVATNGPLTTLFVREASADTNGTTLDAGLTLGPDGSFYGTAGWGGEQNNGVLFKLTTNGTFTPLVSFANTNGAHPYATLTPGPDGCFYGTTFGGGNTNFSGGNGLGTVFKVTADGVLTSLASFDGTNGASPWSSLTLGPDGNFYGTAYSGGNGGKGTIFRLELPPSFIACPVNQSVSLGGAVTFSCQPFGTGPFAYQWLSNGVPIAGATGRSLTLSNISWQIMGAQFQVVIANSWGSILSSAASVHLLSQPTIYSVACSGAGCVTVQLGSYPNSTNRLWATTNLALPFAQWQLIATNVTDSNGLSQCQDTNTTGSLMKFYRLTSP